jgi:hypothetical protein
LLSVTALAWSIPLAQAMDVRADTEETVLARIDEVPARGEASAASDAAIGEAQVEREEPVRGRT